MTPRTVSNVSNAAAFVTRPARRCDPPTGPDEAITHVAPHWCPTSVQQMLVDFDGSVWTHPRKKPIFTVLSQNGGRQGWTDTTPFHGGDWGSNPHGDAISFRPHQPVCAIRQSRHSVGFLRPRSASCRINGLCSASQVAAPGSVCEPRRYGARCSSFTAPVWD
jgi:hypothetical protein